MESVLLIHAHGNNKYITTTRPNIFLDCEITEKELSLYLYQFTKLKQVGLIILNVCSLGKNDFVTCFKDSLESNGIKVGFIVGFKGIMGIWPSLPFSLFLSSKPKPMLVSTTLTPFAKRTSENTLNIVKGKAVNETSITYYDILEFEGFKTTTFTNL